MEVEELPELIKQLRNAPDFKSFITFLFSEPALGGSALHIKEITSPINMMIFEQAFVHCSLEPRKNNEYDEFVGDPIANLLLMLHIRHRFKDIKSKKWSTRLLNNLKSWDIFGNRAIDLGMNRFVKFDESLKFFQKKPLVENLAFIEIMGDVFEAFFGATIKVFENCNLDPEVGIFISRRIFNYTLYRLPISSKYEDIVDPVTRLKELYENRKLLPNAEKWPHNEAYVKNIVTEGANKNMTQITVYGWPNGIHKDKIALATAINYDGKKAKNTAAKGALEVLAEKYNIREQVDPIIRLKEYYEKLGWSADQAVSLVTTNKEHKVTIYGWPKGERIQLASYTHLDENVARNQAATRAILELKKYQIFVPSETRKFDPFQPDYTIYKGPKKGQAEFFDTD